MKIGILGFGKEGKSTLGFIKKNSPLAEIEILDKKFGKNYLDNLERFDLIFRTPGIPYNSPEIQKAIKNGVNVSSATKLFFEKFKGKIIGVTGTKGKGTVSTLIYKILKTCGKDVYLAGNIGKPVLEILPKLKSDSVVVLELSSFQLQDLNPPTGGPDIAVVLDIFPDHLDSHRNFKEYINAKSNIAKFQRKNDIIFYFNDNKHCRWVAKKSLAKKIPIDSSFSNSRELKNKIKSIIQIPGSHNFKNSVMATFVTKSLNCPEEKIIEIIKNFKGNEHRLELIRSIKIKNRANNYFNILKNNRIDFYNDSASTNPQTAAAAVKSFKGSKILIAGGKDKKLDYKPLAKALKNSEIKLVVLFGENKKKIYDSIKKSGVNIKLVKDLKTAVKTAYKTAKQLQQLEHYNATIIIFSPASASFDMFKNYEERGKKFKELVKKLK